MAMVSVRDPLEIDRANIKPGDALATMSSQKEQSSDDFGRFGSEPFDPEQQQYPGQRDNAPASPHEQFDTEVEANSPSNRTVRYSETLALNAFVQQAKPSQTGVSFGGSTFLSANRFFHESNATANRETDDHLQRRFRHWFLHAQWHYPQNSRPTSSLPSLHHPHGLGMGGDAVHHRNALHMASSWGFG